MIKIESKVANYAINVPTKREDITPEALSAILSNVTVAKYHCIVALIYADTLFGIVNNKQAAVNVIPLLAKISDDDASSTGCKLGQQVVIDRTSLERGYHLYLPNNVISPAHIAKYIDGDSDLRRNITMGVFGQNQGYKKGDKIYTVEFKVIPINDLKAMIDNDVAINNPFKFVQKSNN